MLLWDWIKISQAVKASPLFIIQYKPLQMSMVNEQLLWEVGNHCNPWPYNNPVENQKGEKVIIPTPTPFARAHVANCCQKTRAAGVLPPHVNRGGAATDKGNKKIIKHNSKIGTCKTDDRNNVQVRRNDLRC